MSLFNNIGSLFVYPAMGTAEVGYGLLSTAYAGAGYLAGSLLKPNSTDPKYSSVTYLDPKTVYSQEDESSLKSQLLFLKKQNDLKAGLQTTAQGFRDFAAPVTRDFAYPSEVSEVEYQEAVKVAQEIAALQFHLDKIQHQKRAEILASTMLLYPMGAPSLEEEKAKRKQVAEKVLSSRVTSYQGYIF